MKTKHSLLTMVVILMATVGFATEKVKMYVVTVEGEKALVGVNAAHPTSFEITIKNSENETVYFYKTKEAEQMYRCKFDFHDLKFGEYMVIVNCGEKDLVSKVEYTGNEVKPGEVYELIAPCVVQKGEKLNVSMWNSEEKQVYLKVFKNRDLVARIKLGNQLCIQKRLDLSQLEKGDYKVVVTDWNKDHVFTVSK